MSGVLGWTRNRRTSSCVPALSLTPRRETRTMTGELSAHPLLGQAMTTSTKNAPNRRDFLRTTAGGGFALGGLLGLGLDLRPVQAEVRHLKIHNVKEVPSVCPYCAVGCGTLVSVRDKRIVNIEGNPESPINEGTLCPKGAATFQLAVNPERVTTV